MLTFAAGEGTVDGERLTSSRENVGDSTVVGGGKSARAPYYSRPGARRRTLRAEEPRPLRGSGARPPTVAHGVAIRALDAVLPWSVHGALDVRLMKMDVQGFECRALAGAVDLVTSGSVRALVTEVTPSMLKEHGCEYWRLRWLVSRLGMAVTNHSYLSGHKLVSSLTPSAGNGLPGNTEVNLVAHAAVY